MDIKDGAGWSDALPFFVEYYVWLYQYLLYQMHSNVNIKRYDSFLSSMAPTLEWLIQVQIQSKYQSPDDEEESVRLRLCMYLFEQQTGE